VLLTLEWASKKPPNWSQRVITTPETEKGLERGAPQAAGGVSRTKGEVEADALHSGRKSSLTHIRWRRVNKVIGQVITQSSRRFVRKKFTRKSLLRRGSEGKPLTCTYSGLCSEL